MIPVALVVLIVTLTALTDEILINKIAISDNIIAILIILILIILRFLE
ncbi:hypothetical protein [Methanobrevibacter filiformis]|nr:hypothetical protein [Methanobrevibacter filiformis]